MPELPEVETIIRELKKKIIGRKIRNVWTDFKKMIKKPKNFPKFKKTIINREIKDVRRRGKNILIDLSGNKILLIHQKLTGHLLLGKWKLEKSKWICKTPGFLSEDPANKYLHLIFLLDNREQLALSDLRKFAKVELWDKNDWEDSKELKSLGPEPLERSFTFKKFKEVLGKKRRGKIKQILMDQKIIVGIGNIYSDEILWEAKVNPFKDISKLSEPELKKIFKTTKKVLEKAIKLKGTSTSDYRRISGTKGSFQLWKKVYQREGEKCSRCGQKIQREKINQRSAHFCPNCQKL